MGVGCDEPFELARRLGVVAAVDLCCDPILVRGDPQLLQLRDLGPGECLAREVGERRPPPEAERLVEQLGRTGGIGRATGVVAQPAEAVQVELVGLGELEDVAVRPGDDHVCAEHLAQLGDVHLDGLAGSLGRLLAPKRVDQPLVGDDLARVQQQHRQQPALLFAG
jgi:hypothetical protein